MIKTKSDLKEFIEYEKNIYHKKRVILFRPVISERDIAFKYVCLLRYEEFHHNTKHRIRSIVYRYLRVKLGRKYSLYIPINIIDKGFKMVHPHNITINAKSIGKNFSIQFNCSLIAHGHSSDVPTIKDNVTVGVGAVILGGVVINSGIAIGANSTVNKSFLEENICIAGSPAKKISDNGSSTWNRH